jgi:hypothetical protein
MTLSIVSIWLDIIEWFNGLCCFKLLNIFLKKEYFDTHNVEFIAQFIPEKKNK